MSEKLRTAEEIRVAWENVERIRFVRVIPDDKEALLDFVEEPLREAVGILYDKNIQTMGSSCNLVDLYQGRAWISLNGAGLSEANLSVIDAYEYSERTTIEGTDIPIIGLFFPVGETDVPDDISVRAIQLALQFEEQAKTVWE